MKIGKYQFNSKEVAENKISALNPAHKHTVVRLGNIVLSEAEFDSEGNKTKEVVKSEKYHIDVAWQLEDTIDENGNLIKADHPYGWKSASINLNTNGVHSFYGVDYLKNKFL